jgi:hypothetical protein
MAGVDSLVFTEPSTKATGLKANTTDKVSYKLLKAQSTLVNSEEENS